MFKLVVFLEKKSEMTHEEFLDHWHGPHVEMAKEMPNLKKYVTSVPVDPEEAMYDGIAELYFERLDDAAAAGESDLQEKAIEDSKRFLSKVPADRMFVEPIVQMDKTA
ncbi:EthD family reductase [Halorarius litoreus]|uniref:EthD family reductase n=1 Tax=Halorarius litoreus TaxID=2962676 RepID=UPI0020CEC94A|nr:EthD family reductase [Halorarius litoreus]